MGRATAAAPATSLPAAGSRELLDVSDLISFAVATSRATHTCAEIDVAALVRNQRE